MNVHQKWSVDCTQNRLSKLKIEHLRSKIASIIVPTDEGTSSNLEAIMQL